MIAKCIAILALVAHINAAACGCGPSVVVPTGGCSSQSVPAVLASGASSDAVVLGSSSAASGAITRNIVAKGKYPVALKNCGPTPDQQIPVTTSRVTAPVQEKPTVRLPAKIPAPRTVCHTCTCYKTIVRPRVHQQIITVPTVQRYIETLHKPVVENIQYEAIPVNCEGAGSSVQVPSVSSVSSASSVCGACARPVELPCARPVELPCAQPVELPCARPVEVSCARPVELPCAQPIELPCARPVELPCARPVEVSFARPVEVSCARPVELPCARPVEVAFARPVEVSQPIEVPAPCASRVEIPQAVFGSCQC